jgi:MFS family permease
MKGNILVLTVSRVIWSVSGSIVYPYMSLYILELGGSKPQIGLVNAVAGIAGMFLYPVGGYIADKSGRAKLVGVSMFLYASSFLLFVFAPSWQWLAVGMAYQQLVLFYMPALNAIMADSIPVGARGKILSLTMVIPEAVRIFIPYIGGWLIAIYALQSAMRIGYALSFVLAVVIAYMRLRYLRETIENGSGIGRDIIGIFRESYRDILSSIRWVFENLRGYALVTVLLTFINAIVQPFWTVYGKEVIGLSAYSWGSILLIAGLTKTLFSMGVGNLVDRWGPKRCMLIGFGIAVPSIGAFILSQNFMQTAAVYIVLVLSNAFIWISTNVLLADAIPRSTRGRVIATLGQGIGVGVGGGGYARGFLLFMPATLGSIMGGYIYEFSPSLPWMIQATILTLSMILALLLVREPERAEV